MVHFEQELMELKHRLLTMASHAENAVKRAVEALASRDHDLALRICADDEILDQAEIEIDELAIRLLAKAPLAGDLRFITVAMKICQNLERVGDEGTKIAKRARDLSHEPPLKIDLPIPDMASLSLQMLKAALDCFVNKDPVSARALIPRDKEVDALNKDVHHHLAMQMVEAPDTISRCLHFMVVSKSLERIADHAKNIAEEVVYLCEAEDIRHKAKAQTQL